MKTRIVALLIGAVTTLLVAATPSVAQADCSVPSNAVWSGSSQFATTTFQSSGSTLTLSNNQWGEPASGGVPTGAWSSSIWEGPNDGNNSWGVCESAPGTASSSNFVFPEEMWNAPGTPAINTFPFLTTTFSQSLPANGDFEAAYDIWLSGAAPGQTGTQGTEFMIWTHNQNENPGNTDCNNVTIDGSTYDLTVAPASSGLKRIDLLPANGNNVDSGTIDLKSLITTLATGNFTETSGAAECQPSYVAAAMGGSGNPTLTQIDWGFEIHDTGSSATPEAFLANQFILRDTPVAPTGGGASAGSPGSGTVTVSFNPTPASGNGGATVTTYQVTATGPGGAPVSTTTSGSPVTLTGLTPGVNYTISVSALNSEGAGAPETFSVAVPAVAGGGTHTGGGGTTTTGTSTSPTTGTCAKPNATLSAVHVGSITIGESFAHAKKLYPCGSTHKTTLSYWFTLTQGGIRVSEPSSSYLKKLSKAEAKKVKSTVILALTWASHYSVDAVKVGTTLKTLEKKLPHGVLIKSGSVEWYFSHTRTRTLVFEISHAKVSELGLATPTLTTSAKADAAFLRGV